MVSVMLNVPIAKIRLTPYCGMNLKYIYMRSYRYQEERCSSSLEITVDVDLIQPIRTDKISVIGNISDDIANIR